MKLHSVIALLLIISSLSFESCSFPSHAERMYLNRVTNEPLSFRLPRSQSDSAWARALSFVATYETMKVEKLNDSVIATKLDFWNFDFCHPKYGYYVRRNSKSLHSDFRVDALSTSLFPGSNIWRNEYILADYMRSGYLPYPELISK